MMLLDCTLTTRGATTVQDTIRELIRNGHVEYLPQYTLRLVTTGSCQWHCGFCHHEGAFAASDLQINRQLISMLGKLRDIMGLNEIHLTGGEPTRYPYLFPLIKICSKIGYKVKVTTNGQMNKVTAKRLIEVGVKGINISIHTLYPKTLAGMQKPIASIRWATRQIQGQIDTIDTLLSSSDNMPLKINTVIGSDYADALDVMRFCRRHPHLQWRPMNELGLGQIAYNSIRQMMTVLCGKYNRCKIIKGSSACSIVASTQDGYEFCIKTIFPFRLSSICNGCDINQIGLCEESIYGIRVKQSGEAAVVQLCIHRQDKKSIMGIDAFLASNTYKDLSCSIERRATDVA